MILAALLFTVATLPTPESQAGLTCRVRDSKGLLIRSRVRRAAFMRLSGYPKGRPGYVADHIQPLCAGGCDLAGNLQWQTIGAAKDKDRWESAYCGGRTALSWAEWYAGAK